MTDEDTRAPDQGAGAPQRDTGERTFLSDPDEELRQRHKEQGPADVEEQDPSAQPAGPYGLAGQGYMGDATTVPGEAVPGGEDESDDGSDVT